MTHEKNSVHYQLPICVATLIFIGVMRATCGAGVDCSCVCVRVARDVQSTIHASGIIRSGKDRPLIISGFSPANMGVHLHACRLPSKLLCSVQTAVFCACLVVALISSSWRHWSQGHGWAISPTQSFCSGVRQK